MVTAKEILENKPSNQIKTNNTETKEVSQVVQDPASKVRSLVKEKIDPLADDYAIKILSATIKEGKTVRELSRELDIPTATCYRRAEDLLDSSLLKVEGLTQNERARIYKSNAAKIEVSFKFEENTLKVCIDSTENEINSPETSENKTGKSENPAQEK